MSRRRLKAPAEAAIGRSACSPLPCAGGPSVAGTVILLRPPAMALEPFLVGGEIVLRRVGQLLRPGDGPLRGGDLRVDKAGDVQPVRHRRYSTRQAGASRWSLKENATPGCRKRRQPDRGP